MTKEIKEKMLDISMKVAAVLALVFVTYPFMILALVYFATR